MTNVTKTTGTCDARSAPRHRRPAAALPVEELRHPRRAHRRVEREAGNGLDAKCDEREKVDERRQRIVPGGDLSVHFHLQHVRLHHVDNLLLLLLRHREEIGPLGVFVAHKSQ